MAHIWIFSMLLALAYAVCCTTIYPVERNDNITSPNYPENYPNNQDINWILQSDTPMIFVINLNNLDLEPSVGCKNDFLYIFKYSDGYKEPLIGPWCGKLNDLYSHTVSYGLFINFKTDSSVTGQGFHLTYETSDPGSDTLCAAMNVSHGVYGGFVSTTNVGSANHYPSDLNCVWEIPIPDGYTMIISVREFSIEYFGVNCWMDYLSVSSVHQNTLTDIGRYCGKRNPWEITVQGEQAVIRFVTDLADNIGQLTLDYSMTSSESLLPVLGPHVVHTDGDTIGTILIDPKWKNQSEKAMFTWHIETEPGSRIIISARINPEHVNGSAFFTVYDGPDNSFIDSYSYDLSSMSFRRVSSGFHVYIEANLENGSLLTFLVFTFETFNYFRTGEGPIRYLDIGDRTYVKNPKERFRCCTYNTITAPPGKAIAFNLRDTRLFRDASNAEGCSYSGIVLFDGDFSASQRIGPVCDVTENKMYAYFENFVSSSSTIFVFSYSYTNNYGRFSLEYELDPWTTVCHALHMTEIYITSSPDSSQIYSKYQISKSVEGSTINVQLNYTEESDICFVIYLHPWSHNEPQLNISLPKDAKSHSLCQRWSYSASERNEFQLVANNSKFIHTPVCQFLDPSPNDEVVYHLEGNNVTTWSQRLARLDIGRVKSRMCIKLPDCSGNRIEQPNAVCGIIFGIQMKACTWHIQSTADDRPYYWNIEIYYIAGGATMSCHLKLEESINGYETKMTTLFHCVHGNLARMRYYRAMDTFGYVDLTNSDTTSLKVRYALTYISDPSLVNNMAEIKNQGNKDSQNCQIFDHSCYRFHRTHEPSNWLDAEKYCKKNGGQLVSILSVEELEFIKHSLATEWKTTYYTPPLGLIFIGLTDIEKPGIYRWLDGNPLTVSDWYNTWNHEYNIIPTDPPLNISKKLPQPTPVSSTRCVTMVLGNPYYSTNWRKVNCRNLFSHASFICKNTNVTHILSKSQIKANATIPMLFAQINESSDNTSEPGSPTTRQMSTCPEDWTPLGGKCFALLSEDIGLLESTPFQRAEPLCQGLGGTVGTIDTIPLDTLIYYLKLWGITPGDGNILLRTESGKLSCTSLSTLLQGKDDIFASGGEDCVINEGRIGFVLCERYTETVNLSCAHHQFSCGDDSCVNAGDVCDGYVDCPNGEDEAICPENNDDFMFSCHDKGIISMSKYCDFFRDCQDESDEALCIHRNCSGDEFRCFNGQCISKEYMCDHVKNCVDGSDEESCDWGVVTCKGFVCPTGNCLSQSRVHDLIPDCLGESEADEVSEENRRLFFFIEENQGWKQVQNLRSMCPGTQLYRRCHRDRIKCFHRAKTCIYDHNGIGDLLYCRDGSHLRECRHYPCHNMFKCPNSYCLPREKICDGIFDCPGGADEDGCASYTCPGLVRCKGSQQCVPQDKVCDGSIQCKHSWSDERMCDLANMKCPSRCTCHGYNVDCSSSNHTMVPIGLLANVRVLLLQMNSITLDSSSFSNLIYMRTLRLVSNGISSIPVTTFSDLLNLQVLDLRSNNISHLSKNIFYSLTRLIRLHVQHNPITSIGEDTFVGLIALPLLNLSSLSVVTVKIGAFNGLQNLQILDLSGNQLSLLESGSLVLSRTLESLFLGGNNLEKTNPSVFSEIRANQLWTDSYRFCCFVGESVSECSPGTDAFSSCEDLLSTTFLQWGIWFLGIASVLGNSMVLFWRIHAGCSNTSSVFAFNLALSDMLMGLYLIILATMDLYYRGDYIYYDVEWRGGLLCITLGILATISCLMSLLILVCIAWDRFISFVFPFSRVTLTTCRSWVLMLVMWLFSSAIAMIPLLVPSYFEGFYSKNSICLPFNFTNPTAQGREYGTVVFVGLAGAALVVVIVLYATIYCTVYDSQVNAGRQDRSDLVVARRLSLVVVTNVVSWIPFIMANVISMSGGPLTREMAAILTTIILPLNSALNPYLYTFSSCRQQKKVKRSQTHKSTTSTNRNI